MAVCFVFPVLGMIRRERVRESCTATEGFGFPDLSRADCRATPGISLPSVAEKRKTTARRDCETPRRLFDSEHGS